jgi:hypothetical protein
MAEQFEIGVDCDSGGKMHRHSLIVSHGVGRAFGAARPSRVQLQYSCPETGEMRMASFRAPAGVAKPFSVASVDDNG